MRKYPVGTRVYANDGAELSSMGSGVIRAYNNEYAYVKVYDKGVNYQTGDIYEVSIRILENYYSPKNFFEVGCTYVYKNSNGMKYKVISLHEEEEEAFALARITDATTDKFMYYTVLSRDERDLMLSRTSR